MYTQYLKPLVTLISQLLAQLAPFSFRTIALRIFIAIFIILFYFIGLLPNSSAVLTQ
jgi:hypothetical protein